ncbi:MAG: SDR family oxidoreductase [Candidatus Binatia bacterium]
MLLASRQFPPVGDITVLETKDSDWEKALAVNLLGPLKVTRAFIKPMLEKWHGSIIAISSAGGYTTPHSDRVSWIIRRPFSREQPYQSTKAALTALSGYLAEEVKEQNIAVNLINPTGARTTGWEEKVAGRQAPPVSRRDVPQNQSTLFLSHYSWLSKKRRRGLQDGLSTPWNGTSRTGSVVGKFGLPDLTKGAYIDNQRDNG